HVGIDFLAGFSALVEKGTTRGDEALMDVLPEALASTRHLCASVNCGSTAAGISADAVLRMAHIPQEPPRRTAQQNSLGCCKLVAFCNAVQENPFVAGAFHGVSEPEAVVNVGISGPGVVLRAVREVGATADLTTLFDAIK